MPVLGDTLIALGNGPTPVEYEFGGNDEVTPKVVNATFDGTGAGSPFLPVLIVTGPSGAEIARVPAPKVAAGESAEVSWFPRVGGGVSVAGTTAREQLQSNAPTSIPGPGADWLDWNHIDGAALLDLTTPQFPKVKAAGVYGITTTVGVDPMSAGASYYHQLAAGTPGFPIVVMSAGPATAAQSQPWATCTMVSALRANEPLFAYVYNYDAVPLGFYIERAIVQQVS